MTLIRIIVLLSVPLNVFLQNYMYAFYGFVLAVILGAIVQGLENLAYSNAKANRKRAFMKKWG